mmetsp:Transcript_112939/g.360760  ORF Transcript_112939/g.360760 Transcript_112939/m.360760 type:complete len:272 (+) Transcript_112939:313-1128(+)
MWAVAGGGRLVAQHNGCCRCESPAWSPAKHLLRQAHVHARPRWQADANRTEPFDELLAEALGAGPAHAEQNEPCLDAVHSVWWSALARLDSELSRGGSSPAAPRGAVLGRRRCLREDLRDPHAVLPNEREPGVDRVSQGLSGLLPDNGLRLHVRQLHRAEDVALHGPVRRERGRRRGRPSHLPLLRVNRPLQPWLRELLRLGRRLQGLLEAHALRPLDCIGDLHGGALGHARQIHQIDGHAAGAQAEAVAGARDQLRGPCRQRGRGDRDEH